MKLVLVRHGQTASNRTRALDTAAPGAPLDEAGRAQAQRLAEEFEVRTAVLPGCIIASNLLRTQQTARPLATQYDLPVRINPGVREVTAGSMEMSTEPEDIQTYLQVVHAWVAGKWDTRMPGGYGGQQVLDQYLPVIESACETHRLDSDYTSGKRAIVIVSHGAVSRVISAYLTEQIDLPLVATHPMNNASTTVLEHVGDSWTGPRSWRGLTWSDRKIDDYDRSQLSTTPTASRLRD